jgi:hypothetical protein
MAGTLVMTYYIRNKLSQQSTILVIVVIDYELYVWFGMT